MSSFRLAIPLFLPLVVGLALLTGACGAPLVVTGASYAADGGLLVASDKTATDHFASMVSKKDCAMWRVLRGRPVCKDREGDKDPYNVDYTQPQRMVSEDGVQYAPPLRAARRGPGRELGRRRLQDHAGAGGTFRAGDGARRCRA